jgi:quinol monooxygenase YgiN
MIIVAGWIRVHSDERQTYVDGCLPVIESARSAPGCLDFHITADPLDPERVNIFEQWETVADVERFRGAGIGDEQAAAITAAKVEQHEVAGSISLT